MSPQEITKNTSKRPIPTEQSEQKYCIVFWLCSDRASVNVQPQYTTIGMTWAEIIDFQHKLTALKMDDFIEFPMKLLNGELVSYSRHDISAFTVRPV